MDRLFKVINAYRSILIILTVFSCVILYNLDSTYLWKDEAATATVSYNTLQKGYPTVYDGKNLLSTSDGNNFNEKLLVSNHEWLQYYICAASFAVFGKTTFAARFPFALFAIASIFIIWIIAKELFSSIAQANLAGILYAANVQFLLFARQSLYYSLVLFFTASASLMLLKIIQLLKKGRSGSTKHWYFLLNALYSLCVLLLFFSSRLGGIVFAGAVVGYFLYHHDKKLIPIIIPSILGALPWGIWYVINNIVYKAPEFGGNEIESHVFTKIILIFWKLQVYFFPIIMLIAISLLLIFINFILGKKHEKLFSQQIMFFILLIFSNVIFTAVPKWGIVNHYYLSVLIALPFILISILHFVWKSSRALSLLLFLTIIFSNVLNILPYQLLGSIPTANNEVNNLLSDSYSNTTNYGLFASPDTDANFRITPLSAYQSQLQIRCYLLDYFKELKNGYYSPIQEIAEYINERAKPTDTILVVGMEYEPIAFYTKLRVVNNFSTKFRPWNDYFSSYPNQEKYGHLTHVDDNQIDWIILNDYKSLSLYLDDPKYLDNNKDLYDIYTSKTIQTDLSTSADLDYHKFYTMTDGPNFTIWHRK